VVTSRDQFQNVSPPKVYLERPKLQTEFGVQVAHGKSQPTEDKLSLEWAWSLSHDLFTFWED